MRRNRIRAPAWAAGPTRARYGGMNMRGPLLPRLWTERARKFCDIGRAVAYARANRRRLAQPHLLDVGARGGLARKWEFAYRHGLIRASLVEPDPHEAQRLRARYPGANIIEAALGVGEGRRDLYLTHAAGCSSLLPPDPTVVAQYLEPRDFGIDRVQSVQINQARSLIEGGALEAPCHPGPRAVFRPGLRLDHSQSL